jgi:cellulose synthase/poly-beta-1,6-N-acetylglucosamine synthase-like glycosyltransferase
MKYSFLSIAAIVYLAIVLISTVYYLLIHKGYSSEFLSKQLGKHYQEPFVSIIIPTYNEENNIERCLESLRKMDYSNYEVILSDGGSIDRTVELAEPYVDKLVADNEVPEGWIGKNWGCYLGFQEAEGSVLLFTDADTVHKKNSLKLAVQNLQDQKAGLVTTLPYQVIEKWWECIVPIYFFFSNQVSGGEEVINDPKKDGFFAVGQYLLFTRKFYEKIGGHERIKGSIVEDYAFGRIAKEKYNSLYYMNNYGLVLTRMYPDSPKQCWTGWKKCLYAGMKITPGKRIFFIALSIIWALAAPVSIVLAALYGSLWILLTMIATYILYPILLWGYWKNHGKSHWLTYSIYPVLILVFLIALMSSTLELVIRKKTTWKGRIYHPDLLAGKRKKDNIKGDNEIKKEILNEVQK